MGAWRRIAAFLLIAAWSAAALAQDASNEGAGDFALPSLPASAGSAQPQQKTAGQVGVRLRWLSGFGNLFEVKFPQTSQWIWAENPGEGQDRLGAYPTQVPVLRTRITFPESIEILDAKSKNANVEFKWIGSVLNRRGQIITVDAKTRVSSVDLIVRTKANPRVEVTLALQAEEDEPLFWVNPECQRLGISFFKRKRAPGDGPVGAFHYVAATCQALEDAINIFLMHSEDAQWHGTSFSQPLRTGNGWYLYRVKLPKQMSTPKRILGKLAVSDKDQDNRSVHYVVYSHRGKSSPLSMSAGVGMTFMQYYEEPRGERISLLGITPKVAATYQLVPDLIDIGGNAFINAVNFKLSSSPAELETPRFFGINGRIGLTLPIEMGAMTWSFLLGWYYWGMLVPDNSYGIASTSGPQIFISGRYAQIRHRTIVGYIKYAPVSTRPGALSLSNREIAFGAGYELTPPGKGRSWMLTLDASNLNVQAENVANRVLLNTFTLGVSTPL